MQVILKEGEEAENFIQNIVRLAVEKTLEKHPLLSAQRTNSVQEEKELWVDVERAKQILNVRSKNKMQQIRDESPSNGIIISKDGRKYTYLESSLYAYMRKKIVR